MNRTWDFLKYASKSDQVILLQAMKVCNIKVNSYEDALNEYEQMYGNMSYSDMLKNMSSSLNLSLNDKDFQSERLIIGHIGYFLLEHDESFRTEMASREFLPSNKEKFKMEYFLKLKTSNVFWFKIAMYVFGYYHMDVENISDRIGENDSFFGLFRKSLLSSASAGLVMGLWGTIWRFGMFAKPILAVAMPALSIAASVAACVYGINKSINKSFVEKLPIHLSVIYFHIVQSFNVSTIEEAKVVLRIAIMNAKTQVADEMYDWDDVRKGLLQRIVKSLTVNNQDIVNSILKHKELIPSNPLDTYLPQRIINQILKFNRKDLVDFIYEFDVPNNTIRNYKLLESYNYSGKVLLKDYCFPITKINGKRYCLLSDNKLKSLLTQLYYEINNLDSTKLCMRKISGHYTFIQVLSAPRVKDLSSCYGKYANTVVYCSNNTVYAKSLVEVDDIKFLKTEIAELRKRLCDLENLRLERDNFEKRLKDQIEKCHRVKHDLEHLLDYIIDPVKTYVDFYGKPKVMEKALEKFKDSIEYCDILCKSWQILTQENMHGNLKKVPMAYICKLVDDFTYKVDGVKHEIHNQISQKKDVFVYVSEYFELQVINNILSNLNDHAFVGMDGNRRLYSRISNDEVSITISIENNGHPIEVDNPETLFQYRLPKKKGIGLSNIRDCMRYAKGDFRIETNANSEYSTIYVLTFKIVNDYEKDTLA